MSSLGANRLERTREAIVKSAHSERLAIWTANGADGVRYQHLKTATDAEEIEVGLKRGKT